MRCPLRSRLLLGAVLVATTLPALPLARAAAPVSDPVSLVQPLAGTAGVGFPFVGAAVPFGMVQAGPDTGLPGRADPANYTGYAFQDSVIRGFSVTHFSGAGAHLAGAVSFLPTTGPVTTTDPVAYASAFSHADEDAEPGRYTVGLTTYRTRAEVTATSRTAVLRFTYPAGLPAHVLLDVGHDLAGATTGGVQVVGSDRVDGWVRETPGGQPSTVWFSARFDRPFTSFGTWDATGRHDGARAAQGVAGAVLDLDTSTNPQVTIRVAVSWVGPAGAAANLDAQVPSRHSFAAVAAAARRTWGEALSRITVGTGDDALHKTFVTCLYRALLMPSVFEDADGRYRGLDRRVHQVELGRHHYTNLSLWDTYRSQTPLLGLIAPDVVRDVATSLVDDAVQNAGVLPRWVIADVDTGVMSGYPAVLTLAEAIDLLPLRTARQAYAVMLHQAHLTSGPKPYADLRDYLRLGYVGFDHSPTAASDTLEYALADAALAVVARRYGSPAHVTELTRRGNRWRALLDPATHFLRPRDSSGRWASPSGAGPVTLYDPRMQDGYQEGTGWQYLWSVPQDVRGLARAVGGTDATLQRLDEFFTQALQDRRAPVVPAAQQQGSLLGLYYAGDQYTPGNEPDLWAPWFYDLLGQPWKTQQVVQAEMRTYSADPFGLPGNDDAGELSSWYVLAALGLYPVDPTRPVFALSTPVVEWATVRLGTGRILRLTAAGDTTATRYVSGVRLRGRPVTFPLLDRCSLLHGGTLAVTVTSSPDPSWGTGPDPAPETC